MINEFWFVVTFFLGGGVVKKNQSRHDLSLEIGWIKIYI